MYNSVWKNEKENVCVCYFRVWSRVYVCIEYANDSEWGGLQTTTTEFTVFTLWRCFHNHFETGRISSNNCLSRNEKNKYIYLLENFKSIYDTGNPQYWVRLSNDKSYMKGNEYFKWFFRDCRGSVKDKERKEWIRVYSCHFLPIFFLLTHSSTILFFKRETPIQYHLVRLPAVRFQKHTSDLAQISRTYLRLSVPVSHSNDTVL